MDAIDFQPESTALDFKPEPEGFSLGGFAKNAVNDAGQNAAGLAVTAAKGIAGIVNPGVADIPSIEDIKRYPEMIKSMGSDISQAVQHPIDTAYKYPVSTALTVAGALGGASEITGVGKAIANPIGDAVAARLPKLFSFLASVSEGATDTLLENKGELPKVTPEATNALIQFVKDAFESVKAKATPSEATQIVKSAATDRVQTALESVMQEKGQALNEAKSKLGIPVTPEEKEASIVQYGNPHGLGTDNINSMYRDLIDPPKTPEDLVKNISTFKQLAPSIQDEALKVRLASTLQDNINKAVDWTKSGTQTEGVLKHQYKDLQSLAIPDSLQASKTGMKEALDLMKDLGNKLGGDAGKAQDFLQNLFTSKKASAQDYIQKLAKLETESGQPIISKLVEAFKPRVGDAKAVDLVDKASKHFDVPPGNLEAKLQNAFTSDNPAGKDVISNLKALEEATGKQLTKPLRDYFAAKSFSKYASRPGLEVAELLHRPNLMGLTSLAAQSPAVLKNLTKVGLKASKLVPGAVEGAVGLPLSKVLNEASKSALQSVLARLHNNQNINFKDSAYGNQ